MESTTSPDQVRARLNEDLANGKTIVLSSRELDDPSLREQLPQLLEDLSKANQSEAPTGPRIPGYTVLGEIGQGGMSTVYLARQDNLGRHVAIKIAPKWLGGGDRARRMLVQEAHAMARLTHPNIVVIHDIIDVDDTFAIAMEWIDGRTLTSLLRTLPAEPSEDDISILCAALGTPDTARENFDDTSQRHLVRMIHDIAVATQAVHDNDLLHLDIKPSNVLVRRDGTPLLADFGVTREISLELTQTRTFAGTPVYAAPEQLRRDDSKIGPWTDVYSLGVTLYETLARSQPLRGLDIPGIVQCIESGAMPRLSQKVAVPPDLENIVRKAMAPEPEHRYQTASGFADDLLAFLEHRPVQARPLTPGQRLRRWTRNEPWKAALAVALAITIPLLAGLGTYLSLQLPAIRKAEIESRLEQANRVKQETFQRWLTNEMGTPEAVLAIEGTMDIDPGESSLACLLALSNEEGWDHAEDMVQKYEERIERSEGLRMFARKVAERRSFFNDDEVAKLRASLEMLDGYIVALDRVFWATDNGLETSAAEAQICLEEATLDRAPDPLLMGLLAWFAIRAEDAERVDATVQSMWQRWGDDPVTLAWAPLCFEPSDSERSMELSRNIIENNTQNPRGYELLAAANFRRKEYDRAIEITEQAREAGAESKETNNLALLAQSSKGDRKASERCLAELGPRLHAQRRFTLLQERSEAEADAFATDVATRPSPSPEDLEGVFWGCADKKPAVSEQLWQRHIEIYPDRQQLHWPRFYQLIRAGKWNDGAKIARDFVVPKKRIDDFSPYTVRALMLGREWGALGQHAERWLKIGGQPLQAAFYAALANLRLGNTDRGTSLLARALYRPTAGANWYAVALMEDALLRSSPDSPEDLRDPKMARQRFERFEVRNAKLKRPYRGPWTHYVKAQVLLACNDVAGARETIERGLALRGRVRLPEPHAPKDYRQRMIKLRDRLR